MGKYTVVIAEDETLILKNLASMVETECGGWEVAARAVNGREAMDYVEKLRPHLLITDIRMPRADGLEILRFIRENRLATVSVIVTSFDYFNYAREALRYGARDYLLKPVTQAQLKRSLNEVRLFLEGREDPLSPSPEHDGKAFSLDTALAGSACRFPPGFSRYVLFLVHCGNFVFSSGGEHDGDPFSCTEDFARIAESLASDGGKIWMSKRRGNRYWYGLLGCSGGDFANEFIMKFHEAVNRKECPVSVAAGELREKETPAGLAGNLLRRMRHNGVFGRGICLTEDLSAGASMQEFFNECVIYGEKLSGALRPGNIPSLHLVLGDMAGYWREKGFPSEAILNIVKYQYLSAGRELGAPLRVDWEDSFDRAFSQSPSWEKLHDALLEIFIGLFSDRETAGRAEDMMKMIDKYIRDHYAGHITNQTLSKRFGFVPSYISRLFREYKGVSPGEYLTQVRVAKAIELIVHAKNINVCDVARAVGFSDPGYFSRLFRQETGMLPTEYREFSEK
ncbi:MAG: response regulator [Treponema sp.]|jgi:AraC-like DNA-binding protein/ActR/RegA family two-component response regulator|nr:response regulator [Treponema sp.]